MVSVVEEGREYNEYEINGCYLAESKHQNIFRMNTLIITLRHDCCTRAVGLQKHLHCTQIDD